MSLGLFMVRTRDTPVPLICHPLPGNYLNFPLRRIDATRHNRMPQDPLMIDRNGTTTSDVRCVQCSWIYRGGMLVYESISVRGGSRARARPSRFNSLIVPIVFASSPLTYRPALSSSVSNSSRACHRRSLLLIFCSEAIRAT